MASEASRDWPSVYRVGALAALVSMALIPVQVFVFVVWPPPTSVADFYALYQQSPWRGLLGLDLLYLINNLCVLLMYVAFFGALRPARPAAGLLGLALGLVGMAAYYPSNPAFEMLTLSQRFAEAASDAERTALLGAGEALLAGYTGTAFDVYYVLNALALLVFAGAMWRSEAFDRRTAGAGLIAGVLMSIPSTAGSLGLMFSLLSLLPWLLFALLAARRLWYRAR
ncbi:DUF4386 family protein [Haliangium ochraceum]|uniref:DUF4386 family protein n=1 Tax=Haliangium ochraceum (strain DSM 14365 / JCM 11303 / SMP-2) TaxID=502025 RepID=D0LSS0_HALO1|nr:DUF4386 family protein [Haliangium ochraceum]ACY17292.1 hypothetical protein Hoch_4802 [Haliangium ochraceum DSM 14365]